MTFITTHDLVQPIFPTFVNPEGHSWKMLGLGMSQSQSLKYGSSTYYLCTLKLRQVTLPLRNLVISSLNWIWFASADAYGENKVIHVEQGLAFCWYSLNTHFLSFPTTYLPFCPFHIFAYLVSSALMPFLLFSFHISEYYSSFKMELRYHLFHRAFLILIQTRTLKAGNIFLSQILLHFICVS